MSTQVTTLLDNHDAFLGFLERRVESREAAEDILQDAYVRGMRQIDAVRDDEAVVAWFYRLLRNAVVDHYRRRGAAERALASPEAALGGEDVPSPDTRAAICQCVRAVSNELKPEYATAIQRVEIDEVPVRDYAAEAGITPNNAAVRVHRARQALRRELLNTCGTCAEHGCVDCTCSARRSSARSDATPS